LVRGQQEFDEDPNIKILLIAVYGARNDLSAALQVYGELDAAGQLNAGNTGAAGDMAVRAKNYQLAREYYAKAIERTNDENEPTAGDDVALYRARLAEIKNK
jgi:hypothetical protein